MFLYGKNSVKERIKTNPQTIKNIWLEDKFEDEEFFTLAEEQKISFQTVNYAALIRIKNADRLQGIIAKVDNFKYTDFDSLINAQEKMTIIFLDKITDPQNLGAIIRTAACFGGFAICVPKHRACEVNETVLHVASGGENYLAICMVTNLTQALLKAKKAGYWAVGTDVNEGEVLLTSKKNILPFPLCLILGSEGKGMSYGLSQHVDLKITLPMTGAALSLNVASACAIFCYEIQRCKNNN